ncbi:hypothetical protein [Pseudonocardia spinosispora]|uniref:hypothetical protein n=1 Tax=Pseudonocardia spinosispora TaxID=103441 RepID=UPI0004004455|nr:hypothetical protein [Pseudonocardia spinosispora]
MTELMSRTHTAPARRGTRRKAFLLLHIVSAGAWLGIDVVLGVLVGTILLSDDVSTVAVSYRALELFAVWPLLISGALCLASGVALGMVTKYGLVRYWWVLVKLVLNIVLVLLVAFALRPTMLGAADTGRLIAEGAPLVAVTSELFAPPIVSTLALLAAFVLSVFKPWGRTRP